MKKSITLFLLGCLCSFFVFAQDNEVLQTKPNEETLKALMLTCYVCHNPRVKQMNIIAPPLVGVKYHYKIKYPEKSEFVSKMVDFIMEPTLDKAILDMPVTRFGVMPDMPMEEDQVRQIVNYIYDNPIETPTWFPAHFEAMFGKKWVDE
jgi:hypothetical protein